MMCVSYCGPMTYYPGQAARTCFSTPRLHFEYGVPGSCTEPAADGRDEVQGIDAVEGWGFPSDPW